MGRGGGVTLGKKEDISFFFVGGHDLRKKNKTEEEEKITKLILQREGVNNPNWGEGGIV